MSEWRYWLNEQHGTLMGLSIFLVMFAVYIAKHPAGLTANVAQTAANKGCCWPSSPWAKRSLS